jgi:hypothetical protein
MWWLLSSMLLLASSAPLPCRSLEGSKAAVAAFCKAEGKSELFAFVVRSFGAPVACEARLKGKGDDEEKALVCRFADGSRYSVDYLPPETGVITVMAMRPFADEGAIRQLISHSGSADIDWKSKPEERTDDDKPGTVSRVYWSPVEGDNTAGELIYRGDKLVGFSYHYAL